MSSAKASFETEPSGPGVPTERICEARMLVRRLTSASIHSCISSSRLERSRSLSFQSRTASPIGPLSRGTMAPPIDTRSFISVVSDTRQPSPSSPRRSLSGMRTSVR